MGLFSKSKGRGHADQAPVDQPGDYSAPSLQRDNDPNYSRNNMSDLPPIPTNHFSNDSGYYGSNSYTNSNVSSNLSNMDHQPTPKPPKTTIVTTTTTTTTTTTVDSDGATHTQVNPYDPATDPPPASETRITSSTQPGNSDNPNSTTENTTVRRNSTSGGRPIPPRSELRNSQIGLAQSPTHSQVPSEFPSQSEYQPPSQYQSQGQYQSQPQYQSQNQYQPQSQYQPSPLSSHPLAPAPLNTNSPTSGTYQNQPSNTAYHNQAPDQGDQGSTYPSQTASSSIYSNQTSDHTHHSKREGLMAGIKALHGAGEALRGTVNSTVAARLGDERDATNQRAIKEQGLREVRETGIRERGPLAHGGKLRKRSLSRGLGEDRRPLERVDESGVNF